MSKIYTAVVLLFFVPFLSFSLEGNSEDNVAFLTSGPLKEIELPFIYPNALVTFKGYYRLGEKRITVIYTSGDYILPETWVFGKCGRYSGYSFSVEEEPLIYDVFLYRKIDDKGRYLWSVFIISPEPMDCNFTNEFLKDFEFFQRDNHPDLQPLLPAVVELTK